MADAHPGDGGMAGKRLEDYWKRGKGAALWIGTTHPWTNLYQHLRKYMPDEMAKRVAAQWYHDVFGHWPGEVGGKNPAGPG
jgi:hypothetical protein